MVVARLLILISLTSLFGAEFIFTPPQGWELVAAKNQSPYVLATFRAKQTAYPPSVTLTSEPYTGSPRTYVDIVTKKFRETANTVRSLGTQQTKAGTGYIIQVETNTPNGPFITLNTLYFTNGKAYTLSYGATKKAFPELAPLFSASSQTAYVADLPPLMTPQIKTTCDKYRSEYFAPKAKKERILITFDRELQQQLPKNESYLRLLIIKNCLQ